MPSLAEIIARSYCVVETRRDGGLWKDFYPDRETAEKAMRQLQAAHKGRTYELVPPSPATTGDPT